MATLRSPIWDLACFSPSSNSTDRLKGAHRRGFLPRSPKASATQGKLTSGLSAASPSSSPWVSHPSTLQPQIWQTSSMLSRTTQCPGSQPNGLTASPTSLTSACSRTQMNGGLLTSSSPMSSLQVQRTLRKAGSAITPPMRMTKDRLQSREPPRLLKEIENTTIKNSTESASTDANSVI